MKTSYELQELDCNCSDCIFMQRDIIKFKESLAFHNQLQWAEFEAKCDKLFTQADKAYKINELESGFAAERELSKMKYQFDKKECMINYGFCTKFEKEVSFIPNILQLETQDCFKHRKNP